MMDELDFFDVEAYADKSWDEYTDEKVGELSDADLHDLED